MKDARQIALAVALGTSLAACTGSTDPTTATVFDNVRNLSSGEYDRQIAGKEAQAAELVRANEAREREVASLESQRDRNASTIAALQREVSAVRGQAQAARSALAGNPPQLEQLARLESQLNGVQSDANAGADPSVVRSELSRISSAIRALSS